MPYVVSLSYLVKAISPMSHANLKKWPCRHVEFRGQEPSHWEGCKESPETRDSLAGGVREVKVVQGNGVGRHSHPGDYRGRPGILFLYRMSLPF